MSLRDTRAANELPSGEAVAGLAAGRAVLQAKRAANNVMRFPDHTSYLRYQASRAQIQLRQQFREARAATPAPAPAPSPAPAPAPAPAPSPAPLAPTSLSVSSKTDRAITINFTQPSNGAIITNYKYSLNGGTSYSTLSPADATTPVTISGLSAGTEYAICLKAVSAAGDSDPSDILTVTTYTLNVETFTSSRTWTAPAGVESVSYLVVGGGGGGGASYSNIEVIGPVPFTSASPGPTSFWINSISGPNYGKLYKGGTPYSSSSSPFKPVRLSVTGGGSSYPIKPTASSDFLRYKWQAAECVYSVSSGLPSIITFVDRGNAIPDAANNISAGGGGGAGGEVKLGSLSVVPGDTYTIVIGAGGAGGNAGPLIESVGLSGEISMFHTIAAGGGSGGNFSRDGANRLANGFGSGGTGGFEDGMYFFSGQGGSGLFGTFGITTNSNYYKYNTADPGVQGRYVDFNEDGVSEIYAAGGPGGIPNIASSVTATANTGNGGSGSGSELNSFASGRNGASGIVKIKYYT